LVEEGKIAVGDPVSRYIPGFAKTTVAAPVNVRPRSSLRDERSSCAICSRHTAGISYGTDRSAAQYQSKGLGPAAGFGWYTADKDEPIGTTIEPLAVLPFVAQPGDSWVYGFNTDILGCVVERASGMPLNEFVRSRITGPPCHSAAHGHCRNSSAQLVSRSISPIEHLNR